MISRGMKLYPTCPWLATWSLLSSCQVSYTLLPVGHKPCLFLRGAFLKRLPSDIYAHLLREDFSNPIIQADAIYQSRAPPLQFSPSPTFQTSSIPSMLLSLYQTSPDVQLLHIPTTTRTAVVVAIVHADHKPRSAELLAPSRETSSSTGGCAFPTYRFLYSFSSSLSSGFTQFQVVSNRFWSFSFDFSITTLYLKIWCQPAYCGRFFSLMFQFTHNSETTGLIDLFN